MEDKIIIKSKYDKKAFRLLNIARVFLIIFGIINLFSAFLAWDQECQMWAITVKYNLSMPKPRMYEFSQFWVFVLCIVLMIGITFIKRAAKKCNLSVTQANVFGTAINKRVDLPIDSISAIGLGALKSISITTSSGSIKFLAIENRDDIHKVISKLLMARQNLKTTRVSPVSFPSQKDENNQLSKLKELKELLDMGVITQEEFDQKKKQLLGL